MGVMSCGGKVYDDGDPLPDDLLGPWKNTSDNYLITFAGNHASVVFIPTGNYTPEGLAVETVDRPVTISFRVGFSTRGEAKGTDLKGTSDSFANSFLIEFYDFEATKDNLRGTVLAYFSGDDIVIDKSEAENQFYLIPPVGTYVKQ
jgi:hypothetical protein